MGCKQKEKKKGKEKKNVVPSSPIPFPTTHVEETGVTITSMLQLRRIVRDSLCRFLLFEHVGVFRPRERLVDAQSKARKTGCFLAGQRVKKCRIPRVKREIHEFISRTRVFLWEDGSSLASFRMGRILLGWLLSLLEIKILWERMEEEKRG